MATLSSDDPWRVRLLGGSFEKGGERFDFCTSSRTDPEGKFRLVFTLPAGTRGPTEHAHPGESETAEILSGTCRFWVGDTVRDCGPGDTVVIPAKTPHRMHNRGREACVMRVTYSGPRMEDVFVPAAVNLREHGVVRAFTGMVLWVVERQPTHPSSRLERAAMRLLARIFRLFGARRHEPLLGWDRPPAPTPPA